MSDTTINGLSQAGVATIGNAGSLNEPSSNPSTTDQNPADQLLASGMRISIPHYTGGPLPENLQKLVDDLFDGDTDEIKQQSIEKMAALPEQDRTNLGCFLADCLVNGHEDDGWRRAWITSALAALNIPSFNAVIPSRLKESTEDDEWARYWAVIALAKIKPNDYLTLLEEATQDSSPRVRAVSLRLLIECGQENHLADLIEMLGSNNWLDREAACRVLRQNAGHKPLREKVEREFIPYLAACLRYQREAADTRFQAALALGDVAYARLEAIKELSQIYDRTLPDWVRRGCVDALGQHKLPETRDALRQALLDADAEIRVRAANALKQALGVENAVKFIVENVLQTDQPPDEYIDALRGIDHTIAANVLSENLLHPDPNIAKRASNALESLGGNRAMRSLQAQRTKALDRYSEMLKDADNKIMTQYDGLIGRAETAFSTSMVMHRIVFGIGIVTLAASLYLALSQGFDTFIRFIGSVGAVGSVGVLLLLFYRNPLQNINQSVVNLVKVHVVFLGYVRQINQIDATFKQLFLSSGSFGTAQMKETVEQIQDSVKETMEEIKGYLPAMNEK